MKFPIESEWTLVLESDNDDTRAHLADHLFTVVDELIALEDGDGGVEDADLSVNFARMSALFTFTIEVPGDSPSVHEVQRVARGTLRAAIHAAEGATPASCWESGSFNPCRLVIVSEDEEDGDRATLVDA
jgi:hypothetical protein